MNLDRSRTVILTSLLYFPCVDQIQSNLSFLCLFFLQFSLLSLTTKLYKYVISSLLNDNRFCLEFSELKLFVLCKNLSCFLVSHIQVNTSSNRWTCESYQATTRDPSLGGLVSHIKHHLESGISEAFRNLRATLQSIQLSIRSSYPNRTSRVIRS